MQRNRKSLLTASLWQWHTGYILLAWSDQENEAWTTRDISDIYVNIILRDAINHLEENGVDEINLNKVLKKQMCVNWIHLSQDRKKCQVSRKPRLNFIECKEFLDYLCKFYFPRTTLLQVSDAVLMSLQYHFYVVETDILLWKKITN